MLYKQLWPKQLWKKNETSSKQPWNCLHCMKTIWNFSARVAWSCRTKIVLHAAHTCRIVVPVHPLAHVPNCVGTTTHGGNLLLLWFHSIADVDFRLPNDCAELDPIVNNDVVRVLVLEGATTVACALNVSTDTDNLCYKFNPSSFIKNADVQITVADDTTEDVIAIISVIFCNTLIA